ncbi:MAG: FHA domain-containing protein [Pseudobdellovibrionaceae bacterium]
MLNTVCHYTVTVHRKDQTMIKVVNEDSFTIGRSLECTIPLTEDSISRFHLTVHRRQDKIWIEDKGSANGTFVNNVRIAQNTLVNVVASDRIRVGKSDYVISISLEIEERGNAIPKSSYNTDSTDSLNLQQSAKISQQSVTQTVGLTKEKNQEVKPLVIEEIKLETPAQNNNTSQYEAEKVLHEAHKKAAKIIYDGEMQAEKRSQTIYMEARDRRAEAENFYQKKIQDAHKDANNILLEVENQGKELIEQARKFAQEIRDEVDTFSRALREKAWKEAEEINSEARKEAEALKLEALEAARQKSEIEAANLMSQASGESKNILNLATQQAEALLNKTRIEIEVELRDLREELEEKKKELEELHNRGLLEQEEIKNKTSELKKERQLALEELNNKALTEQDEIRNKTLKLQEELRLIVEELEKSQKELNAVLTESNTLHEKIREQEKTSKNLEAQIGQFYNDSKALERKNKNLQEQLAHFKLDVEAAEDQKKLVEKDLHHQKMQVKERLEKESQQIIKESERQIEDAQLEMNKRLQKLEREMLEEIMGRKETLVKDIIIVIETKIVKVLETAKWDQVSSEIFEGISETLEGKAVSFSENSKTPKESASLQRKKKRENLLWMYGGISTGILGSFLGLQIYNRVASDKNPMRTIAAEASRKRLEDLDRRKFNPTQVNEIKENYVDAVIYTSGFAAAYQNPEYQQNLYKAASAYLLKTWRVDEDKSIQVLSISSALIKELNDKKQSIHPDYVKEGIAKMRTLENESLERMKAILGSEVRLDSYRRFERKFFETEVLKKQ